MKQFLLKIYALISLICFSQSYNGPESIEYVPFSVQVILCPTLVMVKFLELDNNNNLSVFSK